MGAGGNASQSTVLVNGVDVTDPALGLSKIRILTNNPKKTEAFEHWVDLKIVDQVPIVAPPHPHRTGYMNAKRDKMGHKLPQS